MHFYINQDFQSKKTGLDTLKSERESVESHSEEWVVQLSVGRKKHSEITAKHNSYHISTAGETLLFL